MGGDQAPLAGEQLPDAPPAMPTVTITLAQLKRFREHYAWLLTFAADVLGVDAEEVCVWAVDRYRHQHGLPVRDPLMRHLAEQADRRQQDLPPAPDEDEPGWPGWDCDPPRVQVV